MMALPGEVTETSRIVDESIAYSIDGSDVTAYMARPSEPGRYPGVIVVHEAFGPVEHIHDVTRRFANRGYVAVAPNLYSRVGVPHAQDTADVRAKMFGLPDTQLVRDLEGAAAWVRSSGYCSGKVGMIGFCSGGRQTLLMASQSEAVDAAVDCWGGFIRTATPTQTATKERPKPIMDLVDGVSCPVFVVIGEEDQNPSPEDGMLLAEKLNQAEKIYQLKVYRNAGHAFFADYRPQYREAAAFALWDDVNAFFAQHLI